MDASYFDCRSDRPDSDSVIAGSRGGGSNNGRRNAEDQGSYRDVDRSGRSSEEQRRYSYDYTEPSYDFDQGDDDGEGSFLTGDPTIVTEDPSVLSGSRGGAASSVRSKRSLQLDWTTWRICTAFPEEVSEGWLSGNNDPSQWISSNVLEP